MTPNTQETGELTLSTNNPRNDIVLMGDFNMIPGQDVSNFHFLGWPHLYLNNAIIGSEQAQ